MNLKHITLLNMSNAIKIIRSMKLQSRDLAEGNSSQIVQDQTYIGHQRHIDLQDSTLLHSRQLSSIMSA